MITYYKKSLFFAFMLKVVPAQFVILPLVMVRPLIHVYPQLFILARGIVLDKIYLTKFFWNLIKNKKDTSI